MFLWNLVSVYSKKANQTKQNHHHQGKVVKSTAQERKTSGDWQMKAQHLQKLSLKYSFFTLRSTLKPIKLLTFKIHQKLLLCSHFPKVFQTAPPTPRCRNTSADCSGEEDGSVPAHSSRPALQLTALPVTAKWTLEKWTPRWITSCLCFLF